jgi:hypothetical protein
MPREAGFSMHVEVVPTAEVMSKVLLLARDKEIEDPNILDQLRG